MLCASLDGRGFWGTMDTCTHTHTHTHMNESLCYPPETITTLLIQDKVFMVLKKLI